jgi:RNA polymerase sigma-70 factor, ECF subfamily
MIPFIHHPRYVMIDNKTIEALKKRSEDAFGNVYDATKRGVYAVVFSVVRSHPATEDIMQDVYMKMMTSLDGYEMGTNFNNWLLTIARNKALDHVRHERRHVNVDVTDIDDINTHHGPGPDEQTAFELLIQALDGDQRSVVLMRIVDDMRFKDIAKVLDKPVGTVRWIYSEAMKTLKGVTM